MSTRRYMCAASLLFALVVLQINCQPRAASADATHSTTTAPPREAVAACPIAPSATLNRDGAHVGGNATNSTGVAVDGMGDAGARRGGDALLGMVLIPGGTFEMGTNDGMSYEAPVHQVSVISFYMDRTEVTVAEFAEFVAATHYVTEAERFGWSGVFNLEREGWEKSDGANWRHPDGAQSNAKPDESVTQVSWNDAVAYAKWAGKRLPTEAEFEYAARGGLKNKKYAWGDELRPHGKPVANWWQGHFPERNTGEDGFTGRAPVKSFAPNNYGLYDVAGNVWEWCADWYADDYYTVSPHDDPRGPEIGDERVIRGGSWLCAENFCTNYRVAGRSHATPDSGLNNTGFRCARDAK